MDRLEHWLPVLCGPRQRVHKIEDGDVEITGALAPDKLFSCGMEQLEDLITYKYALASLSHAACLIEAMTCHVADSYGWVPPERKKGSNTPFTSARRYLLGSCRNKLDGDLIKQLEGFATDRNRIVHDLMRCDPSVSDMDALCDRTFGLARKLYRALTPIRATLTIKRS